MSYRKFVKSVLHNGFAPLNEINDRRLVVKSTAAILSAPYVEYTFPPQVMDLPQDVLQSTADALVGGFISIPNEHVSFEVIVDEAPHIILASAHPDSGVVTFRMFGKGKGEPRWGLCGVRFHIDQVGEDPSTVFADPDWGFVEEQMDEELVREYLNVATRFILGALTMLNTKGISVKEERLKPRKLRGKTIVVNFGRVRRTVILGVAKDHVHGPSTSEGSKQKWHIRRGHIRFKDHPTKKPVWIKPYAAGDMSLGFVEKDYQIKDMGKILYKNNINFSK